MKTLLEQINGQLMAYDDLWASQVRDTFCRKQEDIKTTQNRFFSQYWQGYAWAAILGFIKNRSRDLDSKTKNSSFRFQVISNQSPRIANALVLMAIAKSGKDIEVVKEPEVLAKIISEYAKGGAEFIKEVRETPGMENYFDSEDDFRNELLDRTGYTNDEEESR